MDASDVEFTAVLDAHEARGGGNAQIGPLPTLQQQNHRLASSNDYTELPPAAPTAANQRQSSQGATLEASPTHHPVALPSAHDHHGHDANSRRHHPHFEPFIPAKPSSTKHGLERAAAAGKGLAASARRTVVSGLGALTGAAAAAAADSSATAVDDSYVAMTTPCESPKATGTFGDDDLPPPTPPPALPFRPSASSRAGLAARLGSALHSWTSSAGRSGKSGGGIGDGSQDSAPREGRPGPLGAKYTQPHQQQGRRSSETLESEVLPRGGREGRESPLKQQPSSSPSSSLSYQQLPDGPSATAAAPERLELPPAAAPAVAWGRDRRGSGVGDDGSADKDASAAAAAAAAAAEQSAAAAGGAVDCSSTDEVLLPGVVDSGAPPECDHDTAAGLTSPGPPPAMGVAQRGGEEGDERDGVGGEEEEEEMQEEEEQEEVVEHEGVSGREKEASEEGGEGPPRVADMIVLEPEASQAQEAGDLLIRLPEDSDAAEDVSSQAPAPVLQTSPSSTPRTGGAGEQPQPHQQEDGGAEAGAGSERKTPAAAQATPPPAPAAEAAAPSIASNQEENSSDRDAERSGRGKENDEIPNGHEKGDMNKTVGRKKRAAGLWELKAERGRLENALAEAENDRDVQRARAVEAADRLEEAIARLEGLRKRLGVDGGGGGDDGVGVRS